MCLCQCLLFVTGSIKRLIAYNLLKRERQKLKVAVVAAKRRRERKWWVRPIFFERESYGAWYTLIPTMREFDLEAHFNFMRMTPESFDWLLEKVAPYISKTSRRKTISAGERLAVTLRYFNLFPRTYALMLSIFFFTVGFTLLTLLFPQIFGLR